MITKNKPRIDKVNYYLDIAETVLERCTCLRRKFGAVIVKNDEIMASSKYKDNNDDRLFVAEVKVIKNLAKHSCVIVEDVVITF